ncbi:MAG: acetyl-coenzyme A synthetase, partial [Thaumarchaeota archaeon]|nr:acetyl-coenzyme A synthetase [Nitrososphaerota archaeon]
MSSEYLIGLGNNDSQTRKKAQADFVSFWADQAKNLHWFEDWERTLEWNAPFARWFVGGKINASYNALDIHQKSRATKPAILWEGENGDRRVLTYHDLWVQVNKFSNVLKSLGVSKGD